MDEKNTQQGLGDELEQSAGNLGNTAGSGINSVQQMFPSRQNQPKNPTDSSASPMQTDGSRPAKMPPSDLSSDATTGPGGVAGQSSPGEEQSPLKDMMNALNRQSSANGNKPQGAGTDGQKATNQAAEGNAAMDAAGGGVGASGGAGSAAARSATGSGAQATVSAGAGAGTGAATGTAANTASAAGSAAASSGAAAGGAAGATAGATAGTAVAPGIGTAVGAVLGVVLVEGIKLLFKILLAIMIIVSIFTMLPSSFFDKSEAVIERDMLEKVYTSFYESFENQYRTDTTEMMDNKANAVSNNNNVTLIAGEGAPFDTDYGRVELKDGYLAEYKTAFEADEIAYSDPIYSFIYTREQYLAKMQYNINMMICMTDVQKENWFVQVVVWILDTVTGGWFSDFAEGLSRKWEGFWNDYIALRLEETTVSVVFTEREILVSSDPEEYETITVATVTFGFIYDLYDKGVAHFAEKMGLTPEQYNRAVEMAGYIGELFGTQGDYLGWYIDDDGEHYTDPLPGGSTGDKINAGADNLGDKADGLHWDPNAPTDFPLPGYSGSIPTSRFGPRNYARDPYHTGTDFSFVGCYGTSIAAVQDGIVSMKLSKSSGFGTHIAIYHGDGVSTMYAHMSRFGKFNVGDKVSRGDIIGYVGSTGESTGAHLHIEYRKNGVPYNPVGNINCFNYIK